MSSRGYNRHLGPGGSVCSSCRQKIVSEDAELDRAHDEVSMAAADGIHRCQMTDETEEDKHKIGWGKVTGFDDHPLLKGRILIEWRGKPYRLGITLESLEASGE